MLPFVYEAFLFEEVLLARVSKRESNESSTRTQTCREVRWWSGSVVLINRVGEIHASFTNS